MRDRAVTSARAAPESLQLVCCNPGKYRRQCERPLGKRVERCTHESRASLQIQEAAQLVAGADVAGVPTQRTDRRLREPRKGEQLFVGAPQPLKIICAMPAAERGGGDACAVAAWAGERGTGN